MWYHFERRTLQGTGQCTHAYDRQRNSDQRGGPNQIGFSEHLRCRSDRGFAQHEPDQRFCSDCWHGLFHCDSDRNNEHGGYVEFNWRGLQRVLVWDTGNQFFVGCLSGASRGPFSSKR
jgi:hypothetical protein